MNHIIKHVRSGDLINSFKKLFLVEQGGYLVHFLYLTVVKLCHRRLWKYAADVKCVASSIR